MDVTPLIKHDAQVIQSYTGGGFRVSGVLYSAPIIVFPTHTTEWGKVKLNEGDGTGFLAVAEESFDALIDMAAEIDVVLLGTGAKMKFLEPALKAALKEKGLSVEVMDTGAACRTYNVLMAEGRRVAGALLPV